jgi:hypothetical protein
MEIDQKVLRGFERIQMRKALKNNGKHLQVVDLSIDSSEDPQ